MSPMSGKRNPTTTAQTSLRSKPNDIPVLLDGPSAPKVLDILTIVLLHAIERISASRSPRFSQSIA